MFIRYCAYAIVNQLRVLILCPTGQLVASYRQRLPESDYIRIETIHAGLHIYRGEEDLVQHCPPSTLRLYDAILIDECSQLDNDVARKLKYAIDELPQDPFVALAADYYQLQPVGSGGAMRSICQRLPTITLKTIHRTKDRELLDFLRCCRTKQPRRSELFDFFLDRRFRGRHSNMKLLMRAVDYGVKLEGTSSHPFVWLCVTNSGADLINQSVLYSKGL